MDDPNYCRLFPRIRNDRLSQCCELLIRGYFDYYRIDDVPHPHTTVEELPRKSS